MTFGASDGRRGRLTSNVMGGVMIGLAISLMLWALIVGAVLMAL